MRLRGKGDLRNPSPARDGTTIAGFTVGELPADRPDAALLRLTRQEVGQLTKQWPEHGVWGGSVHDADFFGGQSQVAAGQRLMAADPTSEALAEAAAAYEAGLAYAEQMAGDSMAREHVSALAGGVPLVPAFLAGSPACMRTLAPVADRPAVRLWVECGTVHWLDGGVLNRYGAAVAGLVYGLGAVRPVELWAVSTTCKTSDPKRRLGIAFQVETAPASLAQFAAVFGAAAAWSRWLDCFACDWLQTTAADARTLLWRGEARALLDAAGVLEEGLDYLTPMLGFRDVVPGQRPDTSVKSRPPLELALEYLRAAGLVVDSGVTA